MTAAESAVAPQAPTKPSAQVPLAARIFNAIPRVIWYVFLAYIVLCIVLNVVVAPFVDYRYQWLISSYGWAFLLVGVALGLGLCAAARRVRLPQVTSPFLKAHGFGLFVGAGSVVLFVLELCILKGGYFTSHDMDWTLMLMVDNPEVQINYYSLYPNNVFLGGILTSWTALSNAMGLDPLFVSALVGCASITVSVCLAAFIARRMGGTKLGACAFLLLFVFVGMNENIFVPYSDSYGIFFTTAILFFFVCVAHPAKWPLIVFLTYMGCNVKPTVVAVLAAIVVVNGCLWVAKRIRGEGSPIPVKRVAAVTASCVVALLLSWCAVALVKDQVEVEPNPDGAMTPAHYLKLGLNDEYDGMYNLDDAIRSAEAATPEMQIEANLRIAQSRLRKLGVPGVVHLLVKKNLNTYNKGELLNPAEHELYYEEVRGNNGLVQGFYGIYQGEDEEHRVHSGSTPSPWSYIAQVLWFMILVGIGLEFFRKRPAPAEMVMAIALLLLSGFLLIFECGSRYLYLFSPFYVLLATRGWQTFTHFTANARARITSP